MRCLRFVPLVLLALVAFTPTAWAVVNYIAFVKGEKQGMIRGDVTTKGREGGIQILSFNHEIVSPRDPARGLPSGKRQHKPFTVRLQLDQSTPRLFQAFVSNETLTEVSLKGYMPSPVGLETQHFTVKLTNASIANIQLSAVSTVSGDPEKEVVQVELTYEKISWSWMNTFIAEDSWVVAPT